MAFALPRRLFMVSGPPGSRDVALTFDDGPHPEHTAAVLDCLGELEVKATFFVVGGKAEAQPRLIERIVAEGHALGHHSWTHTPPPETSARTLVEEARRTSRLLEPRVGRPLRLYRPPNGKLTPGKLVGMWTLRQAVILWNRDPKDFAAGGVEPLRRWFEAEALSGGDIVLLHDVHPHIAPVLPAIVAAVRARGLGFTTPDRWLHA